MNKQRNEALNLTSEELNPVCSTDVHFEPETKKVNIDEGSLVFMFFEKELLLMDGRVPSYVNIQGENLKLSSGRYIGRIKNTNCFAFDLEQGSDISSLGTRFGLRKLYALLPEPQLRAALYAFQLILWNRKTKFCGRCGSTAEENLPGILVKRCPVCKEDYYPKISPSVIVAVIKDDEILLAQHKRITNGMYTVLAGFVSPGESLEECIHREIKEETGITVKNIRYFGSQPWPFPDSLMIGFIADFDQGKVKPDNDEITDLKWFKAHEIPEWPDKVSIARALIDYFIYSNMP